MTIYKVLHFPDARLHKKTRSIATITDEIKTLVDDMFETMYHARGIGLAATQIGSDLNLAVIDVTKDKSQQWVLINPKIVEKRNEETMQEACLSVPNHFDTLKRATWVKLCAQDIHGKTYELEAEGLLAHCIQHEVDHLQGILYIDRLSALKKERFKKKFEKQHRDCPSC